MKIALASAPIINRNINCNLSQMERFLVEAKKENAELICFGETFLQGFDSLTWRFDDDRNIAIATNSELFGKICALSQKYSIDMLFGYAELNNDSIYSSCALISNGKLHHNYRRISKGWKEYKKTDEHYREGDTVKAFDYKGKKCVIGLCGDLWDYPERFKLDEELLLWPVYVCWTVEEWEKSVKNEYAEQANKCCSATLYINSICKENAYGGAVYFSNGTVKAELPINSEGLLFVEI